MYKILNTRGLGVSGKQNELIELALTFGFAGVEVDMTDLVGRHDAMGKQFACQFIQSANIDMGTFKLPVKLGGTNEQYAASIAKLDTILELASTLNAKTCYVEIDAFNANYSFQECFEVHQNRLQELAERFAAHSISIGLFLQASTKEVPEGAFKFVQTADEVLTLAKAVGAPNVGICLNTWEWAIGGGTIEQLSDANLTEVRLADVAEDADLGNIKLSDRTALPGDSPNSFSFQVMQSVNSRDLDIPVSASTDLSTFGDGLRDNVVKQLSQHLDLMLEGKDPAVVAAELLAASTAETEEGADAEGSEPGAVDAAETVASGTSS